MDTLTEAERSERMARVRSKNTRPELQLRKVVSELGYGYRLHRADVPGRPDLSFIGLRKAIFVHGCFWHRHDCRSGRRSPKTKTDFWERKFAQNVDRDARTEARLAEQGWRSLTVWECELRDLATLKARVQEFLDA